MHKHINLCAAILAGAALSTNALALEIAKPITTQIKSNKANLRGGDNKKNVVVMNMHLTPKQQQTLLSYQPKKSLAQFSHHGLPSNKDLGMNGVPVLNQGMHGSCVTFATTGAIDAVIGKGDYVSQLCSLELGSYLESNGYMPSGWNGSFGPWVLDQVMRFGIINTENQKTKSCADITAYPVNDYSNEGNPMSVDAYKSMSEDISSKMYWYPHMNWFQRFESKFNDTDQAKKVLENVKLALHKGNRLTIGTFLVLSPDCSAGACATHHSKQDTWALTQEIDTPLNDVGGHEMIITGYDDKAVAVDAQGKVHQGLLTLRNSWGTDAGDNGDYYMSYDYFIKFVGEIQEIIEDKQS